MSGLYMVNERMMSFAEFCSLEEGIQPKETDHGTDFKNGKWENSDHWRHTFFSHKPDHHVLVALNKTSGELAFATHHGEPTSDTSNYEEKRTHLGDAMSVFNKVMHVGLKGSKEHQHEHIRLKPADPRLDSLYSNVFQNKNTEKHLNSHGYS